MHHIEVENISYDKDALIFEQLPLSLLLTLGCEEMPRIVGQRERG